MYIYTNTIIYISLHTHLRTNTSPAKGTRENEFPLPKVR